MYIKKQEGVGTINFNFQFGSKVYLYRYVNVHFGKFKNTQATLSFVSPLPTLLKVVDILKIEMAY